MGVKCPWPLDTFQAWRRSWLTVATTVVIVALFVSACGSDSDSGDSDELTVTDAWSRPVALAEGGEHDMGAMGTGTPEHDMEAMGTATAGAEHQHDMHDDIVTAAVYMTIDNQSGAADRLIGASSNIAQAVEIHNTQMDNGVMQMRMVTDIEIPDGETVLLEPGSYHVMLIGVTQDLNIDDEFEVELEFEQYGTITITSVVSDR